LSSGFTGGGNLSETYFQNIARQTEVDPMRERIEMSPFENESLNEELLHELIALRAYQLYASREYLDGFHIQDWLQAEQEVLSQFDYRYETALTAAG
jgi:hypothetical protein